jgi:type II restriction/modification system DNA methylase subunit YeeA
MIENGYWLWKVQDALQISDTDSLEFEYPYWNPRLNYIPTDYNWRYLCFSVIRLHDSSSPEKYTIKDALSFLHNQQNV